STVPMPWPQPQMSFQAFMDKKAWKDIWGCGQGIGTVDQVLSAGELVDKLAHEYQLATQAMTRQTEQQSA
ncbi:MAG: hypothetical protein EBX54_07280, partial [Betaproteobacteria bacterium]|nr:hypothetical protein [Betaproteobacteria bacterium]